MCNHYRKDANWRTEVDDWSEIRLPLRWADIGPPPNIEMKAHVGPGRIGEFLVRHGGQPAAMTGHWLWVHPEYAGTFKAYRNDNETRGRDNCRSEYADTTKSWRDCAKSSRCAVPVSAFY